MIPLHLARIRRGKSTTSVCDTLCSEAREHKKINLATVTIVAPPTGKRKRNSWGVWKLMQQFEPPIRKCSVRHSMEVMTSECHQIWVPDKPGMDPVQYEQVNKSELFPEVETAVEVYREVMEEKDLA